MKRASLLLSLIVVSIPLSLVANPIPSGCCISLVGPTTITQPGAYRLSNNIAGGVIIDADDVVLDLENRTISGGTNGISMTNHSNLSIKNGIIEQATINGISIDTAQGVLLDSIVFQDNATGVSVLTCTNIQILNCSFSGQMVQGIELNDTSASSIENCVLRANSAPIILSGVDSNSLIFQNISICNNTFASSATGIAFLRVNNVSANNCNVDNNDTSAGDLINWEFDTCMNIVLNECSASENSATGTLHGFLITNTSSDILFDTCDASRNTPALRCTGFNVADGSSNTINFNACSANANTGQSVDGFFIAAESSENIFKNCQALNSVATTGTANGFTITGTNNCLIECVAKDNSSQMSQANGFFISGFGTLVQDSIAKFNTGTPEFGFFDAISDNNNAFFRNTAQGHGAGGVDNFSTNIVSTAIFNPNAGTYGVPSTGDHPNVDNISVILP